MEQGRERTPPSGAVLSATDVAAQRDSERRYRSVIAAMSEGVVVQAANGEIVACNEAAEEILGLTVDQMCGRTSLDPRWQAIREDGSPFPGEEHPAMVTLRTGEPQREIIMGVCQPEQGLRWISINSQPIFNDPGGDDKELPDSVVATFTDITEHRRAEAELRQSQKMEAVGRLAGGIAHDFNNLLTAVMGQAEIALRHAAADDELKAGLEALIHSAERGAALTAKLLTFSRRRLEESRAVDLRERLRGLYEMLHRLVPETVHFTLDLPSEELWVWSDPTEIDQILINLVVNARDAMPEGGQLAIEAHGERETRGGETAGGGLAVVTVRDSGGGISDDLRERIFEPFFTTKEEGEGTGLGLATVYSIVEKSGGRLRVESTLGEGTAFHVALPAVAPPDAPEVVRAVAAAPADLGEASILYVEDDDWVRGVIAQTLAAAGCRIRAASTAEAALDLAAEEPPDLLITDNVMPGMSGVDLALKLREEDRDLRVILLSGYLGNALRSPDHLPPGFVFLQKPVRPRVLMDEVRKALARGGPGARKDRPTP